LSSSLASFLPFACPGLFTGSVFWLLLFLSSRRALIRSCVSASLLSLSLNQMLFQKNPGLHSWEAGTVLLELQLQSFFAVVLLETGSHFSPGHPACDPPILCFLPFLGWQVHATTPSFFPLRWGSHKLFCLAPLSSRSQPHAQLGMTGMYHCAQLLVDMRVSWILYPNWPQTTILPSSKDYRYESPAPGLCA
jgi:hypothetical protein